MESIENMSKKRIDYLTGIANYFGIEYIRVRTMALALGEGKDKSKLLEELEYIKCKEDINSLRKPNE